MSTAIVPVSPQAVGLPSATEWQTIVTMGTTLAKSGLVPKHITSPEAAVAVILQGRELGIGPLQALRTIYLVEGKLTLSADLMAALIWSRCGDKALRIVERSDKRCVIDYQRPGWEAPARMVWTIEQAATAKLAGKDNWQRHPAAMLFARCVSAIAHTAFQDVVMGLYTPDEAEEIAAGEPPPAVPAAARPAAEAAGATAEQLSGKPAAPAVDDRRLELGNRYLAALNTARQRGERWEGPDLAALRRIIEPGAAGVRDMTNPGLERMCLVLEGTHEVQDGRIVPVGPPPADDGLLDIETAPRDAVEVEAVGAAGER